MRDRGKTLDYIERGMLRGLDRKPTASSSLPKEMVARPAIRAWRAPVTASDPKPVCFEQVFRPKDKPKATSKDPAKDHRKIHRGTRL
jgi:hypothetical protein